MPKRKKDAALGEIVIYRNPRKVDNEFIGKKLKIVVLNQAKWYTPFIPALRRQKEVDLLSSRPSWPT